ncbi:hypothetical protein HPP92_003057 [Vanilla planifolia]|uniref:Uncharacterized protein n=1 Tax=Vanilla planifolia TaxID=51239 RepID=A0A835S2B5_VANPL|nr:hypothetical protein HPP92_003057 [Vanilla planifolia]
MSSMATNAPKELLILCKRESSLFASPFYRHHQRNLLRQSPDSNSALNQIHFYPNKHRLVLPCSSDKAAGEPCHYTNSSTQDNSSWASRFFAKWKIDKAEMKERVAKLGLAAILAYGFFDGVTYSTFFVLAFLGYEKSTGKNPAANLKALFGIVLLMWTGNNITRPFRIAGAAALAPVIDKLLKRIQKYFKLPNLLASFALVVCILAASCFSVVGLLVLSRWRN